MKTIMFDVDGVLADFAYGASCLSHIYYGDKVVTTPELAEWYQAKDDVWRQIAIRPYFWADLPSLITPETFARINLLTQTNVVVFCTHRTTGTPHPQSQTSEFLKRNGVRHPHVILSKRKGDVARAIDADFAIDDKPENAACVHWIADQQPCRSFILDWQYNRDAAVPSRVQRVASVDEFLDEVEK